MTNVKNRNLQDDWTFLSGKGKEIIEETCNFLNSEYGVSETRLFWPKSLIEWKVSRLNPFGQGRVFCAVISGKVYASLTLTPKKIVVETKEILIAEIGDSFTHPALLSKSYKGRCTSDFVGSTAAGEYINRSIFGRLVSEAVEWAKLNNITAIYGTPNKNSYTGYTKRLGFLPINNKQHTVYLWVVPTGYLLNKKFSLWSFFSKVVGVISSLLINLSLFLPNFKLRSYDVREFSEADKADVQLLSKRVNKSENALLKDFDWLNWRYLKHPCYKYKIYLLSLQGNIKGWLVIKEETVNSTRQIVICDWLSDTDRLTFSAFVFKVLKRHCYTNSIVKFWSSQNSAMGILCSLYSFKVRPINVIYKSLSDVQESAEIDFINDFCLGASDNV